MFWVLFHICSVLHKAPKKLWVLLNCKEIYEYLYGLTIIEHIFLWGEIILSRNLYVCPVCQLDTEIRYITHLWSFHQFHPQNQMLASDAELQHQFMWEIAIVIWDSRYLKLQLYDKISIVFQLRFSLSQRAFTVLYSYIKGSCDYLLT